MICKEIFINGAGGQFIETDALQSFGPSRLPHAQSALKKILLTPIYHSFSLIRATLDLVGILLVSVLFTLGIPFGGWFRSRLIGCLGCVTGILARLVWSPIRATYLFFRSLYGILIPNHVATVKDWERTLFQIQNEDQHTRAPALRFTTLYPDADPCKVPSFLKYEA